ncbi:MAG: RluA family pseudouridine synthase [Gammaproteobacteria bacterium]|nr:RluA family pseudouridine synthase [Gammaproteobacteria bacterium]
MNSDRQSAKIVQIDADHAGQRIDNFLMSQLKGVPRSHIYQLLRSGQVRVNSGRKKPLYKLKLDDKVRIPPARINDELSVTIPDSVIKLIEESVLFENDDLLVLNKPSGIAVHSGSGLSFGVIEALKQKHPEQFLELAHRLDRETSGCLLIAKNRTTLTWLHELFRDESRSDLGKYYLTLVAGQWHGVNTINASLKKSLRSGEHMVEINDQGQHAVSHFETQKIYDQYSLMQVKIETGRTHQIRVHAVHAGHPVIGDNKYGDNKMNQAMKKLGLKRLFLHASRIELPAHHATSGKALVIEAPLSSELQSVLKKLES